MSFPIRVKLLAAFAVDLLLLLALGYVALQQMSTMNAGASSVVSHTIPSLNTVEALKQQVSAYRVNQLEYMLYTSGADKERSLGRMLEVEARFAADLDAFRALISSPAEAEHFRAVERAWQTLVTTNHQSFIPDARQNNTGTVRPFYSRMNPLYNEIDGAIADLAAESRSQASESINVVQRAYESARSFIVADTVATLVISALIGLVLSGRIAMRLSRLSSAADQVAAGDLERNVEVHSRDELGQLAQAFNLMLAGLRSQRRALEERNEALAASLSRQEQLTADLIRRQAAEEEAHRAQAAAEAASQAKSMFLATMSHELRTPLNAILGYAQIMRLSGAQPAERLEVDPLERILVAGRHLTALVNNVLDFSKIEQGAVELSLNETPIRAILDEAADVIAPLAERNGNTLQRAYGPELGLMLTDAGRLRQVLINLLGNAAKFTQNGQISLRARREGDGLAGETQGADWVVIEVADTGIGIGPEHLGRLFQPFSQVDASVTRRYEGTGLGLALSRQLCRALGGEIAVASEPGRGSTFTVRLPAGLPVAGAPSSLYVAAE